MSQPPIVHHPGDGAHNAAFHLDRWFRLTPRDTGGAFALFEEHIPQGSGPPLHIHHTEHEIFTVLTGRVRFHCDGHEAEATPGTTVLIPPGAPHAFKGLGPGMSRVLIQLSPGRGVGFFTDVAAENLSPETDMDRILQIAADYDLEFVGPPLT